MTYKNPLERRRGIIEYLRKNPKATHIDIRKNLKTHPERIFKKGMAEAYKEAGIKPPRTFKRNNKEENKKLIINIIRKNPGIGGHTIAKKIKRNPSNFLVI